MCCPSLAGRRTATCSAKKDAGVTEAVDIVATLPKKVVRRELASTAVSARIPVVAKHWYFGSSETTFLAALWGIMRPAVKDFSLENFTSQRIRNKVASSRSSSLASALLSLSPESPLT